MLQQMFTFFISGYKNDRIDCGIRMNNKDTDHFDDFKPTSICTGRLFVKHSGQQNCDEVKKVNDGKRQKNPPDENDDTSVR